VTAPVAMGEHSCGMQAAMTSRFADSGGAFGCANAQGSNFEPHPVVEQALCRWCGLLGIVVPWMC
jgi:hypothetical protein